MTTVSGWCSAPTGLRPHHEACRWPLCSCGCHHEPKESE